MINGYIPAARFLPFLSWTDVAALPDKSNTVIVLPTGAIEQHGPHLPCSVDSVISSGVAGHALARLPAAIPAYAILPGNAPAPRGFHRHPARCVQRAQL